MTHTPSARPTFTIAADGARALLGFADSRGLDAASIARRHGIEPAALADPDGRVPASAMVGLWHELPLATRDPFFGLHLAAAAVGASPSLGSHLIRAAPTLGAGLERLLAFERIVHDVAATTLEVRAGRAVLEHRAPPELPLPRHAAEFAWAFVLLSARGTTGVALVARAVEFPHEAPPACDELTALFGVAPRFGGRNALELDAQALALPQHTADARLAPILERHARELLASLDRTPQPDAEVRAAVRAALLEGEVSLGAVAARIGLGPRSLQRRLERLGTSFQRCLDDVRRELALGLVAARAESLAEIAFALGFADQAAFHRAFVRWAGTTPGAYRRAAAGAGAGNAGTGTPAQDA